MRMNPVDFGGAQPPIDGYAPGGFRIAGVFRAGPVLLTPSGVHDWPAGASLLDAAAAQSLLALKGDVDVLLVGMGAEIAAIPPDFETALQKIGLTPEPAATPSACRTYNVLLSEGRRVAAALSPV